MSPDEIVELMNHPLVRRQMALTSDNFDVADCAEFIAGKEQLWADHGYGPWAFVVDGAFVGWGGLQPEGGDADLALVLHPKQVLKWRGVPVKRLSEGLLPPQFPPSLHSR